MALSDEKREGIFSLLVNEQNLSTSALNGNLTAFWEDLKEPEEILTRSEGISKALQAGFSAASLMVKEEFEPFIKSLERRLNRDIKRVFEYYETLKSEIHKAFEKKFFSGRESPEAQSEEGRKVLSEKLDAVEGEKRWKIQDLVSKYALNVRIEPVCIIDIETESLIFWLEIKRRLSSRTFPLSYNPLLKKVDSLPCESCFTLAERITFVMKSCTSFVLLVSGNVLIAEESTALPAIRRDAPGARIKIPDLRSDRWEATPIIIKDLS